MAQPVYVVTCAPAVDSVPVAPCGTVEGVAMAPAVSAYNPFAIDSAHLGQLFEWSFSVVLMVFIVGFTIGSILRVIRSV